MNRQMGGIYDDVAQNIRNNQRAGLKREQSIQCPECGESYNFEDYWNERYVEGKDWDARGVYWICGDCLEEMYAWYERRRKAREHKTITEWSE